MEILHEYYETGGSLKPGWAVEEQLGLSFISSDPETSSCPITAKLLEDYVQTYSYYELVKCLDDLGRYVSLFAEDLDANQYDRAQEITYCDRMTEIYGWLRELQPDTQIVFDGAALESLHGTEGYYGGMADTASEESVRGRFNVGSDNHIVRGEKSKYQETKYYGDWAVTHIWGHEYDEGVYGWRNGEFIDIPAHWVPIDYYDIDFCGWNLLHGYEESPENLYQVWNAALTQENGYRKCLAFFLREAACADPLYGEGHRWTVMEAESGWLDLFEEDGSLRADRLGTARSEQLEQVKKEAEEARKLAEQKGAYLEAVELLDGLMETADPDTEAELRALRTELCWAGYENAFAAEEYDLDAYYQATETSRAFLELLRGEDDRADELLARYRKVTTGVSGRQSGYSYNAFGSLLADEDYSFGYDELGRVTEKTYRRTGVKTRYAYGEDGALCSVEEEDSSFLRVRYELNERGEITKQVSVSLYTQNEYVVSYAWDEQGRLIHVTGSENDSGHEETDYEYDGAGRLSRRTSVFIYGNKMVEPGRVIPACTTDYRYDEDGALCEKVTVYPSNSFYNSKRGKTETVEYSTGWILLDGVREAPAPVLPDLPNHFACL
ncbi:MAG: hypothetical protein IJR65_00650 [Oscillospiraceae bacterium]|nr:hypothetical protein [Oscillospiraceae bacterium]